MTEADVYAALTALFHELFADDSIVLRPETTANDVQNWDSFNHLNIIVAVEQRFGFRMQTRDIESLTSIAVMVRLILARAA